MAYEAQIRHRNRHRADADHCEIKSPMDGMVVLQTRYRNGQQDQIKLGDELAPGQPFMRIVEPNSLLLDATMNQAESEDIRLGQKAVVHFDAFPDLVLHGHVTAVGAIAMSGRRVNYFIRRVGARIALDDRDARVLPDLTASADITTSDESEGLIVPREAVQLTRRQTDRLRQTGGRPCAARGGNRRHEHDPGGDRRRPGIGRGSGCRPAGILVPSPTPRPRFAGARHGCTPESGGPA